jgi:hypothetical protein
MRTHMNPAEKPPEAIRNENSGELDFSIMVNSHKGLSAIMELIMFEDLYFEGVRGTFLLITFNFLIAEMVA